MFLFWLLNFEVIKVKVCTFLKKVKAVVWICHGCISHLLLSAIIEDPILGRSKVRYYFGVFMIKVTSHAGNLSKIIHDDHRWHTFKSKLHFLFISKPFLVFTWKIKIKILNEYGTFFFFFLLAFFYLDPTDKYKEENLYMQWQPSTLGLITWC